MKAFVPPEILDILRRLEGAGFETWCVGGAVRDVLLGASPKDFDLATAARPADIRRIFPRTIPVGIEHGTVGVLDNRDVLHEVTSFRKDVKSDGRRAVVEFGVSLDEDLARRDFTINAVAYHPEREEWRDPFDGRGDLQRRVIRAVGDPVMRFREDRLRILRAIRFSARLDFNIHEDTLAAMLWQGPDTGHLSAERVRDEWVKSLRTAQRISTVTDLWHKCGIAKVWLPELSTSDKIWRLLDDDSDRPSDPVVLTAILTSESASVWRRLKGSGQEIQLAEAIDRGPLNPSAATPAAVRRWLAAVGRAAEALCVVSFWHSVADEEGSVLSCWREWSGVMREVINRRDPTTREALALRGDDLIREGIVTPGPGMGRVLDRLLDAVLEDPALNSREALLHLARQAE